MKNICQEKRKYRCCKNFALYSVPRSELSYLPCIVIIINLANIFLWCQKNILKKVSFQNFVIWYIKSCQPNKKNQSRICSDVIKHLLNLSGVCKAMKAVDGGKFYKEYLLKTSFKGETSEPCNPYIISSSLLILDPFFSSFS